MRTARRLSELLDARGVREIFGNPGTTELPFLDGVIQRYYLTLHDAIAVGAADGAAQVTRTVAVANLHAAPGLGNSVGFIDSARRNRSPVLITVGQQDLRHADQRPLLFGDLESMVHGLVKYSHELRTASELEDAVRRAWYHALDPPPGPVLLSLPMNVMEETAGPPSPSAEVERPPSNESADAAVERIRAASSPVVVVGYEVDVFDAFAEVAELAGRLGAPVYAEPICSRSPVPSDLPNFVGDLLPQSAMIGSVLGTHDLIVLVGSDLTLYPYSAAPMPGGERLMYIGSDPSVSNKLRCAHVIGNLRDLLREILTRLPASGRKFAAPPDFARANRVARAAVRMGGAFVVDAVQRVFRGYTVVDESVSLIPTMKAAGFYHGRDSYFSSRSQQLGWGLAAAIGLGLHRPHTVVVIGDGALQYSVQALGTIARYRIPVKVVVVNNSGYAILKSYARANHPSLISAEYLDVPGIRVDELARGYGLPASRVDSPSALDRGLEEVRDADGPALVNVAIDRSVPDLFS